MIITKEYDGQHEIKSLDINKLIILVGAGVSIASPTRLPSGQMLTEYYLQSCIGKELANQIIQRWKKLNKVIYMTNGFEIPLLRLEFIIGCIDQVDIEFNYNPFIMGFEQFVNVSPNINHHYLAELLKGGCKIITPNFDCGIEKNFDDFYTTTKLGIPVNEVNRGTIYHYHGIGTQYDHLGATIAEIKKGLKKEFKNQLKKWFEKGYSIISVGFSCSDYFDMTPFFETLTKESYTGTAIFFQHGNIVEKEVENKITRFYSAFKDSKILYGDTTTFLSDLCMQIGGEKYTGSIGKAINWKEKFECIRIQKRENLFYLIKLLNQSGLNLTKDIFESSQKPQLLEDFKNINDLLEYAMQKLKGIDVRNYIKNLEDRSKSIFSDIIDMCRRNNYSSDNFRKIEKAYYVVTQRSGVRKTANEMQYNELVMHIKKSNLVPQNFTTPYVYAFNRISKEQIRRVLNQGNILSNDKKIIELYECAIKMLQLPFYEYEYISYYISIIKVYNILSIMLGKENNINATEDFMINIALEICGFSLVIKTYFNTVLQNLMLFAIKKEWSYFQNVKEKMLIIKECIDIAGNYELMIGWKSKNSIIQEMEKKYKYAKEIDFNVLKKLL